MKHRFLLVTLGVLFFGEALAVPMDTSSALGGFVSWRDCTAPEQQFCDGGFGSTNPASNNGTGDRSVLGGVNINSISDSIDGGPAFGSATFAADMLNSGMGVTFSQAGNPGPDGRVMTTVGGYQGFTYTGGTSVTKTMNASMFYSKSADVVPTNDGNGVAYSRVALIKTTTDTMVADPDLHFLGTNSIGRDLAFEIVFSGTAGLNSITIIDQLTLEDSGAANNALLAGSLDILLNPGDVFFVVAAAQAGGNQSGFGSLLLDTAFTDTSGLEVLSVPSPASLLLFLVGLAGLRYQQKHRPAR